VAGTPPSSVPSSSGSGVTEVFNSVLGAPAANFDITPIAAGFHALLVLFQGRSAVAAASDAFFLRVNNDSGGNYDTEELWGALGGSGSASATGIFAGTSGVQATCVGDTAPAGNASQFEILLYNYDGTTFRKQGVAKSSSPTVAAAAGFFSEQDALNWRSTAAITRLTIFTSSGNNWMTGSRCTVLGL
jgi:hypothetical protein